MPEEMGVSLSVKEMVKAGTSYPDGRPVGGSFAEIRKRKPKGQPTSPADMTGYHVGCLVCIRHSNLVRFDDYGRYKGKVVELGRYWAKVLDEDGMLHTIECPKDMSLQR